MSVNKVILIGNLGRDPELRATHGGGSVCSLSVATTRKWRNKDSGEMQEETEWHKVVAFGQQAERCNNYLAKGRMVYIEGRIKTRSYDDKDGVKRYTTEVIADQVTFLGGRGDGEQGQARGRSQGGEPVPYDPGDYSGPADDDCPF
jgi:single-strand DNA-binding protein